MLALLLKCTIPKLSSALKVLRLHIQEPVRVRVFFAWMEPTVCKQKCWISWDGCMLGATVRCMLYNLIKIQKLPPFVGMLIPSDLHHILMVIPESNRGTAQSLICTSGLRALGAQYYHFLMGVTSPVWSKIVSTNIPQSFPRQELFFGVAELVKWSWPQKTARSVIRI
jgi:hypothetical protein